MKDIIIIGAGTAGLTAAIYGTRAGKNTLIIEANTYGGQIVNATEIENYPGIKNISGFEFATNLYEQAKELGAQIVMERVLSIDDKGEYKVVVTNKNSYESKTVIIATGAKNKKIGIPNEKEYIGRGVSYCATCDGAFFRGRDVAIVGGGNTALEDAMFLSHYCNKVYLIHRRDEFRGEKKQVDDLSAKDNIEFVLNSEVVSICGDEAVTSINVKNRVDGNEKELTVDGIFIAIGQAPDNEPFKGVVELDEKGYIIAGEDCTTKTKGIFVAGDCRTKDIRQLSTAAADGAVAALKASEI